MSQTLDSTDQGAPRAAKSFEPGTLGWIESDLDDTAFIQAAGDRRVQIIHGVLTLMPSSYFAGGSAALELVASIRKISPAGRFASEVDIVLQDDLVLQADFAWLSSEDWSRHVEAARRANRKDARRTRILVPPSLVIESISPGHASHDRKYKFQWYAEFGVTNYWILDGFSRTLDCFRLDQSAYQRIAGGSRDDQVALPVFQPAVISLGALWV